MVAGFAGFRISYNNPVSPVNVRPPSFIPAAPAAQAKHDIILFPIGERVPRRVYGNNAPAVSHILHKGLPGRFGPGVPDIIEHNKITAFEVRPKDLHVSAFGGCDGLFNLEKA
jgi:hypothetical protein